MDRLLRSLNGIAASLDQIGVKYALVGGLAVSAWGKARLTKDIDLKVNIDRQNLAAFQHSLLGQYRPLSEEALAAAPAMGLLFLLDRDDVRIDLMLLDTSFDEKVLERAQPVELAPGEIYPVASPEDIIVYKLLSTRPHDLADAASIVKRQGKNLDRRYLRRWLEEFEAALDDSSLVNTFLTL